MNSMRPVARKIAALLVVSCFGALLAAKKKADTTDAATQQEHALHAVDRLTFGPRPGDVQAVMAMGVDKWIELQLHPEKIDNAALDARLGPYRTLHMSPREMAVNFPPPQVLKAVQDGKLPMPTDPYRRAVYSANLVRLEEKKEARQQENAGLTKVAETSTAAATANNGFNNNSGGNAPDMQDQANRRERRTQVEQLSLLDPATRMARMMALPPEQQSELVKGLPEPARQGLLAGLSPEQRETVLALAQPVAVVDGEVQSAKILRAVYSNRQLEEVLTDFWFNHFNVFIGKGADRYLVTSYERDVIRPHVLGKFKDLLIATAQSPAMLLYLDNWQSVGPHSDEALGIKQHVAQNTPVRWRNGPFGPHPVMYPQKPQQHPQGPAKPNAQKKRSGLNENYARELMELHTLGVNGGYTQQDVTEVARVFTGWTLQDPRDGGGFVFKPRLHEPGTKTVLGHKIKESGEKEGTEVLEMLAHSPATAKFISTELAERFVSDKPPQSLIDSMSKTFLKTDGDLREVMRTMFRSQEFWAPAAYNAKVKTPLEFVASSLRATQTDVTDPLPLLFALNQMGMPLYGMQAPTGYSTQADVWVNSAALLARMNFALGLVNNKVYGSTFDLSKLTGISPLTSGDNDPYQIQLRLEQVLLDGDVSAQTHRTIEEKVATPAAALGNPSQNGANAIAALLLGSPEFQRH
jgi:uncharacterized protein (DUF1800 family)